jgi:sigma-B regulation protein RsbU (phosphoserine phosphatase)
LQELMVIKPSTSKTLRLVFGSAIFVLLFSYWAASFYLWLHPPGSDADWHGAGSYGEFRITRVDPKSESKDLRPGDRIVAINGLDLATHPEALGSEYSLPPGSTYSMTVRRDGQEMTFSWRTIPRIRGPFPWQRITPLLFWLFGLVILLLKADDAQACLLAFTLGTFATLFGGGYPGDMPLDWMTLVTALARAAGLFSLPLLFHLFLVFPQKSPWLTRWPSLKYWLYLPFLLFVIPTFGVGRLPIQWSTKLLSNPIVRWLGEHGLLVVAYLTLLGYLLAALLSLVIGYRMADLAGRRRIRVVMWGSLIGFGSLLLVIVMESLQLESKYGKLWDWLGFSTLFTLPLVPLSFAYAIIRHRVIPVSLILRRGARYVLVLRGAILLEVMAATLLVMLALTWLLGRLQMSPLVIVAVSGVASVLAWQVARALRQRYLAPLIDRRFFRQAYDAQQVLGELAMSLHTTNDIRQVLEGVANTLQTALQTESAVIFLVDQATGDYLSAYGCRYSASDGRCISTSEPQRLGKGSTVVRELTGRGTPLDLDGSDPAFDLSSPDGQSSLTLEEKSTLSSSKSALLIPLKTKDGLRGLISLGSRLGDLPYSGEDKRLLQSVGASASLALENARLVAGMLAEAQRRQEIEAENEQRARDMEEARQLQVSMLPMKVPRLRNAEIAAYMKTATEVGGDYYDFYLSDDGTLTIAIGDATGHGLKAGTVVTATKGLFSHLAEQSDLTAMLTQTSRALKRMNLRSLFMAMTVVRLSGNRLECSVAGMPPILIYRAGKGVIEEIPLYGAPLGGLSHYVYHQATAELDKDDVVLLMSDGMPERFNETLEMFGYERTRAVFLEVAQHQPATIIEKIVSASEEWSGGKAADDDMTFVALRIQQG